MVYKVPPRMFKLLLAAQTVCIVLFIRFCLKQLRRIVANAGLNVVPGPPSKSFFKGTFREAFNPNAWEFYSEMEQYGTVVKVKALLGENQLFIFDPKALTQILTKDQHIFEEGTGVIEGRKLMFGNGLLSTNGEHHRKQRKMLNPVFSIAHMRDMVPIFSLVVNRLCNTLKSKVQSGPQEVDIMHWLTRTAMELLGQSGLAYSFDPLTADGIPHPFTQAIKDLGPALIKFRFSRTYLLPTIVRIGTPRFRRFILDILPLKDLHRFRDIVDLTYSTSLEVYESKKKALYAGDELVTKQIGQGKDILSILMRANLNASNEDKLPEDEIIGQIATLIFAGTDTTSAGLARILHLLSINQDVQERLRLELAEAKMAHGNDLSYDVLVALPYLDAICRETLRLFPPVTRLQRTTRKDVVLSLSKPIKATTGEELTELLVPENTDIIIGIMACNRNPDLWGPDANEWKPERWLNPLPETVTQAHLPGIYSNLMTFIGGGRSCIGFKFSQLEMKSVLSSLITSFKFTPSEKEIIWKMTGIAAPTIHGSSDKAKLPLVMEMVQTQ
ncbi:Cytochrome P450 monooxygenase 91 [Psilocybe cubensis]|uniref:Cytochrome P450 monooxygenase 91 n=2 Tax=Psilocybe cubensis TaxID=181762 RepID=A0ACB8H3F7_PSICU|nr:Cytochrome P450 monooxygenase 91 [Psilocybe cubensis]KAH9482227.1 Cytochrome P450 monooxygenase 91 [Psilocybe cubensis]